MRSHALTYPQLMNQASAEGLPEGDRVRLREGYELAQGLMDGLYRKYGTPFLCHAVRTASVVLRETRDLEVVLAALLHAAYFLHTFEGSSRRGPRPADRELLQARLGIEAETLIRLYTETNWDAETLAGYAQRVDELPSRTRNLLLIALANELEDHLDAAEAYAGHAASTAVSGRHAQACIALAQGLGHDALALDLREAFDLAAHAPVAPALRMRRVGSYEVARLWKANPLERIGAALRRLRSR